MLVPFFYMIDDAERNLGYVTDAFNDAQETGLVGDAGTQLGTISHLVTLIYFQLATVQKLNRDIADIIVGLSPADIKALESVHGLAIQRADAAAAE